MNWLESSTPIVRMIKINNMTQAILTAVFL